MCHKILIVDEDERLGYALSCLLKNEAVSIITAPTKEDAYKTLRANSKDLSLIITELSKDSTKDSMLKFCSESIPHVPIVAVVADYKDSPKIRCRWVRYFKKPISIPLLIRTLMILGIPVNSDKIQLKSIY